MVIGLEICLNLLSSAPTLNTKFLIAPSRKVVAACLLTVYVNWLTCRCDIVFFCFCFFSSGHTSVTWAASNALFARSPAAPSVCLRRAKFPPPTLLAQIIMLANECGGLLSKMPFFDESRKGGEGRGQQVQPGRVGGRGRASQGAGWKKTGMAPPPSLLSTQLGPL